MSNSVGLERNGSNWSARVINVFFCLLSLAFIVPLVLVISISLTDEKSLLEKGYHLFPKVFSLQAYKIILQAPDALLNAYGITILVTVIGTFIGLLLTSLTAYTISRRDYRYRRVMTMYVFFTSLFSGGLVPFYILVTQYLHLKDSFWALIVPYLLSPFYILVMKGFMDKLPIEIFESAKIDGANEWRIFFTMVLPLSIPALVTIGLFISFQYWNDWWLGLLFIDNPNLVPLQLLLYRIMSTIDFLSNNIGTVNVNINMADFPSLSARMAMAVLAAGPMMIIFPMFQRFFISGLTVGAIKG
ncbi:ABC transporter permease subunit [Paenibacillus sp. LMG 31458]|uniref:ABC transporter permease subunit n=2 Tax=Paenibacillus TaxID=44249 RepID=A0ABX1ZGD0_9BACL|nr:MULTISPECIES: carbohydrate ABC transporter permease [Paenibacillus]NOU71980.1 ABC transporter permease subunit [Paenibacillus phytorum]NOU91281.1 ABC transporter permease subunit [Paenibacillus germinis]